MKGSITSKKPVKKPVGGLRRGQKGFTLVELLVVVGIIVALAAVIIPNVARFSGRGEAAALAAEKDNVQAALDTAMADKALTTVTANTGIAATGTNAWSSTGGIDLDAGTGTLYLYPDYLRDNPTKYWYCWDTAGLVKAQYSVAATACPP